MSSSALSDRVVILTGATGGIGKILVEALIENGARVGALDVDAEKLAALQDEYGRGSLHGVLCDVSSSSDCARAIAAVSEHFNGIHVLINNAALGMNAVHPGYEKGQLQIEDVSEALWSRFMVVNVNGPYFMTRAVVPAFRRQAWGRIINISTSYLTMMRAGFAPYGPTKAALEAWSLMLARQLEGSGITVNVVLPGGPVDTQMIIDYPGLDRKALIAPSVMRAPVLGLLTPEAEAVTGQRFIAVEWDAALGSNPAVQPHRSAAWPEFGKPFSQMRS